MSADIPPTRDQAGELVALVAELELIQQRILELAGGRIDAVVGASGDLNLLPAAQEQLRQREAAQRAFATERAAILDALPARIALLDRDGAILVVNKQWQAFAREEGLDDGYTFTGKNYLAICDATNGDEADAARAAAAGIRSVLGGTADSFAMEYACPSDERMRWFQLLVSPLAGADDGVVVMHVDVTEQRWMREELRAAVVRWETILDNLPDGIVTISEQGTIQASNRAAEWMFGYAQGDMLGRDVSMLIPAHTAHEYDDYLKHRMPDGKASSFRREVEGLHADRSRLPLELRVSDMHLGGQRYFLGILRDISERKRLEKLQNEFVSTASHELRTPLASILGALKLMTHGRETLPPTAAHLLALAYRNAERLDHLVNDIFDVERLGSGRIELKLAPLALLDLVAQSLKAVEAHAAQHRVRLQLDAVPGNGPIIRADGARMRLALAKLLDNAVKFSPSDETVRIRVDEREGWARVEVEDHGPGIAPEAHRRIFELFVQADGSSSRRKGGSGLGLYIAKALIEQHHGKLDVRSEPGRGATFWFELPVWTPSEAVVTGP